MNPMARLYASQLIRILYFVLICGCICVTIKFLISPRTVNFTINTRDENLNQVEETNSQRIERVKKTCEKYNLGLHRTAKSMSKFQYPSAVKYRNFYIDRLHNISLCPIYKSGSTTWIHNLCSLMGVSEDELLSGKELMSTIARRVISRLDYPEAEEAMQKTAKLMIVRHPFERILSGYRDKLENTLAGRENFQDEYGTQIVQKYRDKNFPAIRENQVIRNRKVPGPVGIEPTFREFIDYVINTDLGRYHSDDHWIPYYQYCTPCSINYNFIGKVETLWQDQVYTIRKLKLDDKIKPHWRNNYGQSNTSKIYFSQLNKNMVDKLYEKFRLDFELFDYSPEEYYNYATSPL